MKKNNLSIYLINITLVLFLFLVVLKINNIYPFGKISFGISDGLTQFRTMIYDLLMKIKLGLLTSYSFTNGLGNPTLFNILYYTSSPIQLFGLFFNNPQSMYFFPLVIKLVIASINTTLYSKSKTNNSFAIIIANIAYCFSSWFITYYYYSTFVDIFMMFPLFQYGLEKLLDENDKKIYIFSLAYMIIVNFYLTFSVCVYTVVYFVMREIFYKKNSNKELLTRFKNIAIATTIVFFLVFFWLFMLVIAYKKMDFNFDAASTTGYFKTFTTFVGSLFYGEDYLIVSSYGLILPNIACITIILVSLVYYFFNDNFLKRERFYVFISLLLAADFMLVPQLDYILNLFHAIRGLAYRYSFIPTFLTIILFLRNSINFDLNNKKTKKKLLLSIAIITIVFALIQKDLNEMTKVMYIMMVLIFIVIIFTYQKNIIFKGLILSTSLIEIIVISSFSAITPNLTTIESINDDYTKEFLKYRETGFEGVCLRHDTFVTLAENCNMFTNTPSINLFTSMTYGSVIYTLNRFGYKTGVNTAIAPEDYENNLFVDMIFNVKNDYYLEKIFAVNKDIKDFEFTGDIPTNQNTAIEKMTGITDIIYYDEELSKTIKDQVERNTSCEKSYKKLVCKNDTKTIITKLGTELSPEYFVYNDEKVKASYEILKKNQIKYTTYKDSLLEGTINVDKNQLIFTSIPYDTDWHIYIDGKEVKAIKLMNSLIGIEVEPGKHKIKMEYKEHVLLPFMVSLTSFAALIISIIRSKKYEK